MQNSSSVVVAFIVAIAIYTTPIVAQTSTCGVCNAAGVACLNSTSFQFCSNGKWRTVY